MEILTHSQAWGLFYQKFRNSEGWHLLTDKEKNRLINADRDSREERDIDGKKAKLGYRRAKSIIEQYAPNLFTFVEGAVLNDDQQKSSAP